MNGNSCSPSIFSSLFYSVSGLTRDFDLQSALISTPACHPFYKFSKVCFNAHYSLTFLSLLQTSQQGRRVVKVMILQKINVEG